MYFKYCLRYGKVNQKTREREPMAVRSVRDYRSILYSVFNQATIDGLLNTNPVIGVSVRGKKNTDYSEEMLFMTEEEIAELLRFISEHYPRLLGITFVGAYYGLRRSEILGLKWSAIDFKKKTVSINHTVVRVKTVKSSDSTKTLVNVSLTSFLPLKAVYSRYKRSRKKTGHFSNLIIRVKIIISLLGKRADRMTPFTYPDNSRKQQRNLDVLKLRFSLGNRSDVIRTRDPYGQGATYLVGLQGVF